MEILQRLTSIFNRKNSSINPATQQYEEKTVALEGDRIFLHGHSFYVDPLDSLGLRDNPIFEYEETKLCNALISQGDICLDIGANIGYYTSLFSTIVGTSGKVIAVEPDPENYALLELNCTPYIKNTHNISLHQVALSDANGEALLFKSKDNHGMHRLYSSVCCSNESSEVQVIRGDDLLTGPVDFIKIDIEGYELSALKGLKDTINASQNIKIITEFSPLSISEAGFLSRDVIKVLVDYDLVPLENKDGNWVSIPSSELLKAADIADSINITDLTQNMSDKSNQEIAEAAQNALIDTQYPRPLLENLLWVRPSSLEETLSKLSLN